MDPPKKLLIVGEKFSGKSSIVSIFKEYDGNNNNSLTGCTSGDVSKTPTSPFNQTKKTLSSHKSVNQDFSLKILKIQG